MSWSTKPMKAVLEELDVEVSGGLPETEVAARLERYGANRLEGKKKKSLLRLFLAQLNAMMIYILLGAAVLSVLLGEVSDAVIIILVVLVNGIVGVVQEAKAEQALEALKKLSAPKAVVRRNGAAHEVDSDSLVPGDVVLLEAGRVVPCDLRLLESANLQIDEAALTGESVPAEKDASYVAQIASVPLGDQRNMAFTSTIVTYGRGTGVAVATGMATEIGRIAELLAQTEEEDTPLQRKLDRFGKTVGFVVLGLCALMFGLSVLREYVSFHIVHADTLFELFLTTVSLAVAAIPEGLPAIVTIVLAVGVQRMSRENAIVRRLPAVETLGSVTLICSDKTGTLTQNRMTVRRFYADGRAAEIEALDPAGGAESLLLRAMALCNDAGYTAAAATQTGDPTEIALLAAASSFGLSRPDLERDHPRVAERPFDSVRKRMSTVNRSGAGDTVYTKGALDQLLEACTHVQTSAEARVLGAEEREHILHAAEQASLEALRILGFAYRPLPAGERAPDGSVRTDALEHDLVLLGYVGMIDPPRMEVRDTIAQCRRSGIEVAMITGDHRNTALAIARELGIASDAAQALSGSDLENMDDAALAEKAKTVRVFARVSPEHKVRIVEAFKRNGHIVSMTGDGVNDAPSLERADIGVAMGITGTDVAKGASDMVLADDNFTTIVSAVAAGRNIYANVKKAITFLLSCNAGEVIAVFSAIMAGLGSPLRAIHILWVNLVTDTFPALSLGMDPHDPHSLRYPPRNPKESLFAGGAGAYIVLNGALVGILTLAAYLVGRALHPGEIVWAQTMAFAVLSLTQLVHAFNLRHFRTSVFALGVLGNRYLVGSFVIGAALQFAVIMVRPLAAIFKVIPLGGREWLIVAALSVAPLLVNELVKVALRIARPAAHAD